MKRNRYAAVILVTLALLMFAAGWYISRITAELQQDVQAAYALAVQGDCPAARRAYERAAAKARKASGGISLLVRRTVIDQLNQTLAVLPPCAETDSMADLEMETQRACAQIQQLRQSFFGGF